MVEKKMNTYPEDQVKDHQRKLNAWALENSYTPLIEQPLPINGKFGPLTTAATAAYEDWLLRQPAPPVPWWTTGRMKGMLTEYSGIILGIAGILSMFMPSLRNVNFEDILNTIIDNTDHFDTIVVSVSALMVAAGRIWSTLGAVRAKAPIDTNLVARIGKHDITLAKASGQKASTNTKTVDDYLGSFKSS